MNTYIAYKALKQVLKDVATTFWYNNQYDKGNKNTVLRYPAIFIEMKKESEIKYFGNIQTDLDYWIKIHLLTKAPFKDADTTIQDGLIASHASVLDSIKELLDGTELLDDADRLILAGVELNNQDCFNFGDGFMYSILNFTTELHDYSLVESFVKVDADVAIQIGTNITIP